MQKTKPQGWGTHGYCITAVIVENLNNKGQERVKRPRFKLRTWGTRRYFEYSKQVDKVLVIRDSDCADAIQREQELQAILTGSHFQPSFPFHFYATKCELETWLLADEAAVNTVAQIRGKKAKAKAAKIDFENYRPAKELFERTLSEVQLPADSAVYREVAAATDIKKIASKCPRFALFASAVRAC